MREAEDAADFRACLVRARRARVEVGVAAWQVLKPARLGLGGHTHVALRTEGFGLALGAFLLLAIVSYVRLGVGGLGRYQRQIARVRQRLRHGVQLGGDRLFDLDLLGGDGVGARALVNKEADEDLLGILAGALAPVVQITMPLALCRVPSHARVLRSRQRHLCACGHTPLAPNWHGTSCKVAIEK